MHSLKKKKNLGNLDKKELQDVISNNSSFPKIFLPIDDSYKLTHTLPKFWIHLSTTEISRLPPVRANEFNIPLTRWEYFACYMFKGCNSFIHWNIFSLWGEKVCDRCLTLSYKWYFEIMTILQHCFTRVAYICCMCEIKTNNKYYIYVEYLYLIYLKIEWWRLFWRQYKELTHLWSERENRALTTGLSNFFTRQEFCSIKFLQVMLHQVISAHKLSSPDIGFSCDCHPVLWGTHPMRLACWRGKPSCLIHYKRPVYFSYWWDI